MSTIPGKPFADADQDRQTWQNVIETAGQGGNIVALTKQLDSYTAFLIPTARQAEYDASDNAKQLKFVNICQRVFQRTSNGETDFLTVFEQEYAIEFG